jgi:hypothetical protein
MELVEFYRALLPAFGSYALWYKGNKQHVWADSLDDLVAKTSQRLNQPDWYFATAAFDEHSRKQDHVQAKRCLYLDLDAGPEKLAKHGPDEVYATNEDAQRDVVRFARATGMVPSMIVHSGTGLHVYFAATEDIDESDWSALAGGLGALAKQHGVKADAACTTDSARILRPLGSLHGNGERVRLLRATPARYSLETLRSKLAVVETEQFALTAPPRRAKLDVNAKLALWEPAPTSAIKVAEHCGALREIAAVKGDKSEPYWRAMIGVVKFTTEGEDIAQEWSSGHDEYDPVETARKYHAYEGTGPTRCETFGKYSRACETCAHKGKITTPAQLGRLNNEEVAALPEEKKPAPVAHEAPAAEVFQGVDFGLDYRVEKVEGRYVMYAKKAVESKDPDGKAVTEYQWVLMCDEVFWIEGWCEAGAGDADGALATLHAYINSTNATASRSMPASALATAPALFDFLGKAGITPVSINLSVKHLMHNYTNSQFGIARRKASRLALRHRFGLQYDSDRHDAELICAHGPYVIRADGTIEEAALGPKLIGNRNILSIRPLPASPTGKWGPEVWKKHIMPGAATHAAFLTKYYTRPGYEAAQLATMLQLSSPFMVFAADTQITPGADLPPAGLTVSLYSAESGQGKTSMQKVIASAYGDPSALVRSGAKQDSTPVAMSGFAALLGTMPLFLDEVTQNAPKDTVEMINRLSQGQDRHRGTRNGDPKAIKPWALIASVSTNIPQRELISSAQLVTEAVHMRVLEIPCLFPVGGQDAHVEFERDRDAMLSPNYGCLGALINFLIVRVGAAAMRKKLADCFREAANVIAGSTQRERFFQRGLACVLACHDFLSTVKLAPFARESLIAAYVRCVHDAGSYLVDIRRSPEDLMRKMVSDLSPHIIVTYGEGSHKAEIVRNAQQLRAPYVGRRIETTRTVILMSDAMKTWARDNQVSYSDLLKRAKDAGVAVALYGTGPGISKRVTITRGTDLSTVGGQCYAFDERRLFSEEMGAITSNVTPLHPLTGS